MYIGAHMEPTFEMNNTMSCSVSYKNLNKEGKFKDNSRSFMFLRKSLS